MKKIIILSIFVSVFLSLNCKKETDIPSKNILNGTKWTSSSGTDVYTFEFTTDSDVQVYTADLSGNPQLNIVKSTYILSGNDITFPNKANMVVGAANVYKFSSGTLSGNVLKTTYSNEFFGKIIGDGTMQFLKKQ